MPRQMVLAYREELLCSKHPRRAQYPRVPTKVHMESQFLLVHAAARFDHPSIFHYPRATVDSAPSDFCAPRAAKVWSRVMRQDRVLVVQTAVLPSDRWCS